MPKEQNIKSHLHRSRLVSAVTLISRFSGLARDMLLAGWLGNNWIQDRFNYGFRIPNLFRNLLGEGALSAAFVPILSEKLNSPDRTGAYKLFSVVATVLAAILILLTALIVLLIAGIFLWKRHSPDQALFLGLGLTAVMVPYMIFVCLVALFSALLNCLDRFGLPAFMSVVLNLFQIAALIVAPTALKSVWPEAQQQIYAVAISVVLAGVVQLWMMIRAARRVGVTWHFHLDLRHPDLRRMAMTAGPIFIGLSILQFGTWLDDQIILSLSSTLDEKSFSVLGRTIDYPLMEGALSAVNQARRLYQFPLGVLAVSLATVAFPMFSRLAAQKDYAALSGSITHALRLAIFEALPSTVGLIVLAPLIVRVIFERGRFTPEDTVQTAHVLRFYCLGLWAYCSQQIVLRAFYSLSDTMTPLKIMAKTITLAIVMNVALLWLPGLRAGVFGLSTSVMVSLNVIILGVILSRRIATLDVRSVVVSAVRSGAAAAVMGAAAWLAAGYLPIPNKYLLLLVVIVIAGTVFLLACWVLRIPEAKELLSLARARRK
jgi:putative peptidoglycan lipid II flippase